MSDRFVPLPLPRLAAWIAGDLRLRGRIGSIPRELFWQPRPAAFHLERYGVELESPIGVAAGPHTQLAMNLVNAYLMGARFLELKTIQTLDELDVAKPCIDAEDATFNCEWSQELRLQESFDEYLHAFVLIHALRGELGWGEDPARPGFLFNMSVGYDLAGILKPNVQAFLDRMADPGDALDAAQQQVAKYLPGVADLALPRRLSDNVTLSTMHGCPPDEIERIGRYLIEERGLHTTIKLNPTLLGPERLRGILNDQLGFQEIEVPDEAFDHDLKYNDALSIVANLREAATRRGVFFGLKLTNTLEVRNHRPVFRDDQTQMYMSGRSLHPLTMTLAATLIEAIPDVPLSISGGVDAFNLPDVLAAGLAPVTVCSDLLKPGGYLRMPQYLERLEAALGAAGADTLDAWARPTPAERAALAREQASRAGASPRHRARPRPVRTKGNAPLDWFDCVEAPCEATCPAHQEVPAYLSAVAHGRFDDAARIIEATNPLPRVTGAVCDHPCEARCVRNHYEAPLAIRDIKRFAIHAADLAAALTPAPDTGRSVAVIGAGPAGLAAAFRLRLAGYRVEVFDAHDGPGGMVRWAIPAFRLGEGDLAADLARIQATGVSLHYGARIGKDRPFEALRADHDHVIVATGAPVGRRMGIPGEQETPGVDDGLSFLTAVRRGEPVELGEAVCIVGGGNAAMDAARTAWRLSAEGQVRVLYRRTRAQMPADPDEVDAVQQEGVAVEELVTPTRVLAEGGRIRALECVRTRLSDPDGSGRPHPVPIEGSEHTVDCSRLIVCVSQETVLDFLPDDVAARTRWGTLAVDDATGETTAHHVWAAGDVVSGPATIIAAVASGQRVARAILARDGAEVPAGERPTTTTPETLDLIRRRGRRVERVSSPERAVDARRDFLPVSDLLSEEAARAEAARCLRCDEMCSLCVTVCPNRANQEIEVQPVTVDAPRYQVLDNGALRETGRFPARVRQRRQIVNVTDLCNECGNCVTFCPTAGAPYRDKPRLHLNRASYDAEADRALHLRAAPDGAVELLAKIDGAEHRLILLPGGEGGRYVGPAGEIHLDAHLETREAIPHPNAEPGAWLDGRVAVRLAVLAAGIRHSLPSLLTAAAPSLS